MCSFLYPNTRIIHILYYRINHRLGWLTCWRSNWLKIKLFKLFYFSYLDQYYGYFPIINFSKQNFFYVVVDESCIGFLIQKLITSNLFVSLSLSLSRPTKSSFQRERFSFFFPPYDSNKVKWTEDDRRGTRDDLVRPKISRQLSEATLSILPEWP